MEPPPGHTANGNGVPTAGSILGLKIPGRTLLMGDQLLLCMVGMKAAYNPDLPFPVMSIAFSNEWTEWHLCYNKRPKSTRFLVPCSFLLFDQLTWLVYGMCSVSSKEFISSCYYNRPGFYWVPLHPQQATKAAREGVVAYYLWHMFIKYTLWKKW